MCRFRVNGRPVRRIFRHFLNVPASCEHSFRQSCFHCVSVNGVFTLFCRCVGNKYHSVISLFRPLQGQIPRRMETVEDGSQVSRTLLATHFIGSRIWTLDSCSVLQCVSECYPKSFLQSADILVMWLSETDTVLIGVSVDLLLQTSPSLFRFFTEGIMLLKEMRRSKNCVFNFGPSHFLQ